MTGMKLENNQVQALAFMLMLAVISVIWDLGRAHRANASPDPSAHSYSSGIAPTQLQMPGEPGQLGLIQTGYVDVTPLNGHGPTTMPVFQMVRLGATNGAQAPVAAHAPINAQAPQNAPAPAQMPSGISMTPPMAAQAGALCEIKSIQVLTQSGDACVQAGGRVLQTPY